MGGSTTLVTSEARHRDTENNVSIPTPVTSRPSTPVRSVKRKYEEGSPYLGFRARLIPYKHERATQPVQFHQFYPSETYQLSPSLSPPNSPTSEMTFLSRPINYVFGKLSALSNDLWNQCLLHAVNFYFEIVQLITLQLKRYLHWILLSQKLFNNSHKSQHRSQHQSQHRSQHQGHPRSSSRLLDFLLQQMNMIYQQI